MIPPKLMKALVAWLRERVPEVADRVQSWKASPGDAAPYLTYHGIAHVPAMHMDARDASQGRQGGERRLQVLATGHVNPPVHLAPWAAGAATA